MRSKHQAVEPPVESELSVAAATRPTNRRYYGAIQPREFRRVSSRIAPTTNALRAQYRPRSGSWSSYVPADAAHPRLNEHRDEGDCGSPGRPAERFEGGSLVAQVREIQADRGLEAEGSRFECVLSLALVISPVLVVPAAPRNVSGAGVGRRYRRTMPSACRCMGTRATVPPAGTLYRVRMYLGRDKSPLFNLLGKLP